MDLSHWKYLHEQLLHRRSEAGLTGALTTAANHVRHLTLHASLEPEANWYSLNGLPSAADNWPPNPDEVDLLIQSASIPSYYQFAATLEGLKFGRVIRTASDSTNPNKDSLPVRARGLSFRCNFALPEEAPDVGARNLDKLT